MNVFYDHQTFSLQNYGGISRYHAELAAGVSNTQDNQSYISLLFSNNIHLSECGFETRTFFPNHIFQGKGKFIYYSNQLFSINQLRNKYYNIFHATYYDTYFLQHLKDKPFVVTFHDMIYEKFNDQFSGLAIDTKIIENKRLLAKKAARIIAVSESTKNDIVELLDIDPEKIAVIYHGSSLLKVNVNASGPTQPYLLYVGNRYMYKNFKGLLTAIHSLLKTYEIRLLCVGGGEFTSEEKLFIHSLNVEKMVEQHSVNNRSLSEYYQQAIAFVFPSLYEGFGIPVLEAFACDCPCILSNVSSLPEVAGDAALYFDPITPDSITKAVEFLLSDSLLRATLIKRGRERLTLFSWEQTVNKTLSLYNSIC